MTRSCLSRAQTEKSVINHRSRMFTFGIHGNLSEEGSVCVFVSVCYCFINSVFCSFSKFLLITQICQYFFHSSILH